MADNYIADARVKIDQDCNLSRQAFLAECLERLRNYEQQAAKRGQPQVEEEVTPFACKRTCWPNRQNSMTTEQSTSPAEQFKSRSAKTTCV